MYPQSSFNNYHHMASFASSASYFISPNIFSVFKFPDCLINIFFNNYLVRNQNWNKANTLHLLDTSIKPQVEFWRSWWNFHGLGVRVGREMDKSKMTRPVPAGWKSESRGLQCFPAVLWNTLGLSWWRENPASRASGTGGFHDDGYYSIETQQHREPSVQWLWF